MSFFDDSPQSRFNGFDHQTGCTIISSQLAVQTCVFGNLRQSVQEDFPDNTSGYHFATPCAGTLQIYQNFHLYYNLLQMSYSIQTDHGRYRKHERRERQRQLECMGSQSYLDLCINTPSLSRRIDSNIIKLE